ASSQMKWNEVPIHMMPTMTWAQRRARLIQSATIGSMPLFPSSIPSPAGRETLVNLPKLPLASDATPCHSTENHLQEIGDNARYGGSAHIRRGGGAGRPVGRRPGHAPVGGRGQQPDRPAEKGCGPPPAQPHHAPCQPDRGWLAL